MVALRPLEVTIGGELMDTSTLVEPSHNTALLVFTHATLEEIGLAPAQQQLMLLNKLATATLQDTSSPSISESKFHALECARQFMLLHRRSMTR
jgi:hypothetical protein